VNQIFESPSGGTPKDINRSPVMGFESLEGTVDMGVCGMDETDHREISSPAYQLRKITKCFFLRFHRNSVNGLFPVNNLIDIIQLQ
jgi:hypothetical protein